MRKRMGRAIYWIVIAIGLVGLGTQLYPALSDFLQNGRLALVYPYVLDYGEGPLLDQTLRLAKFENIYKNSFADPPYTLSNYPPLFLLLQVPFAWIFGPALWYGRLVILLSTLLAALFMTLTVQVLTRNWIAATVSGLLLLAIPYIQHWSRFNRIDMLALALSWAGLYVCVHSLGQAASKKLAQAGHQQAMAGPRKGLSDWIREALSSRSFWLAALLFVGAIFTRQTYAAAAPFAAFFWLIFGAQGRWLRRITRAVMLAVLVGGLTLGLFLAINLATQGGFYLNIVTANVNKFNWDTVWHFGREIRDQMWPLYGLGIAFLVLEALVALVRLAIRLARHLLKLPRRAAMKQGAVWKASSWALVLPYALVATAVSVTIGKEGSNVNYLLELAAALCLGSGAVLAFALRWKRWYVRLPLFLAVMGLLAYQCTLLVSLTRKEYTAELKNRITHQEEGASLAEMVRATPGIVLADEDMGLVALAGKPLYLQPFEYKQLADGQLWDETNLLAEIKAHKFDLILWYQPPSWKEAIQSRWTVAQRSYITMWYDLDQVIGYVSVYRPKK